MFPGQCCSEVCVRLLFSGLGLFALDAPGCPQSKHSVGEFMLPWAGSSRLSGSGARGRVRGLPAFGLSGYLPLPAPSVSCSRELSMCCSLQDDVMMPQRVRLQYEAAVRHPTSVSADAASASLPRLMKGPPQSLLRGRASECCRRLSGGRPAGASPDTRGVSFGGDVPLIRGSTCYF